MGTIVGEPERRHGGVNGLWRVRTDRGDFAVHAMHGGPSIIDRLDRVLAVEQAAAAAGVRVAAPVPDPETGRAAVCFEGSGEPVVVHEWVDAEPVHVDRCPPSLYRRLGASVALVHGLDVEPPQRRLTHHLDEAGWRQLAADASVVGLPWADTLAGGAPALAAAGAELDAWERDGAEPDVVGHRDLTSMNVLDLDGAPVLLDWEDAGTIGAGDELGRTALDNVGRDGVLDDERLTALLSGYAGVRPLPPIGPHWCGLWIRGLVVFAEHCARSCIEGTADPSLLRLQSSVVETTVPELRRRIDLVPTFVAAFERAAQAAGAPPAGGSTSASRS